MSLNFNSTDINDVYFDSTRIHKIYHNGSLEWSNDIEFLGSASVGFTNNTTAYVDISAINIQAGDVILCANSNGYHTSNPHPLTPSGFTSIYSKSGGGSDTNSILRLSYKIAVGNETSVAITSGSNISNAGGGAVVFVFRHVDTSVPLDVGVVALSGNTYNNNVNPLAITPLTEGAVIVAAGCSFLSSGAASYTSSDMINMKSAYGNGSSYGSTCGMAMKEWSGSGSFDPAAWGYSGSTAAATHMVFTIALRPKYY